MTDIIVPTLGESVIEATTVGRWTMAAGDAVKRDEVPLQLETDKVAPELRLDLRPALAGGDAVRRYGLERDPRVRFTGGARSRLSSLGLRE